MKVRIVAMSDDRQEAEFITNEIPQRTVTENATHEDFAILFRMNAQSRLLETHLRELHIPYRVVGGKSFFDAREIKDLLAYASVLLNADDDVSLLRIVNTPARGISSSVVERATELSAKKQCSVFAALQDEEFRSSITKRASESIETFTTFLDAWETKLNQPLVNQAEILRAFIKETGYLEDLKRSCKTPEEGLKRESKVSEIIKWFEQDCSAKGKDLREFLDDMMLRQEKDEEDDDSKRSGVTLITLHAAKGLEFPHVYLVGLEEGVLPHDRSKMEGTVDEERRLLYVGITRARKTLALTWCRDRIKYGSPMPCTPSSFIKELPGEWVDHQSATQILRAPVSEGAAKSRFSAMRAMLEKVVDFLVPGSWFLVFPRANRARTREPTTSFHDRLDEELEPVRSFVDEILHGDLHGAGRGLHVVPGPLEGGSGRPTVDHGMSIDQDADHRRHRWCANATCRQPGSLHWRSCQSPFRPVLPQSGRGRGGGLLDPGQDTETKAFGRGPSARQARRPGHATRAAPRSDPPWRGTTSPSTPHG